MAFKLSVKLEGQCLLTLTIVLLAFLQYPDGYLEAQAQKEKEESDAQNKSKGKGKRKRKDSDEDSPDGEYIVCEVNELSVDQKIDKLTTLLQWTKYNSPTT